MRKRLEWEWERLDEATWRSRVVGGWIVLHTNYLIKVNGKGSTQTQSESMTFVADRDHEWTIMPRVEPAP